MDALLSPRRLARFGVFELDVHTGDLRKAGRRVRLGGQPLRMLELLLDREGDLLSREEIQAALWPGDTLVDVEHSVNAAMKRLRAALGDEAERPRFIETVPRRGYRLLVPVTWHALESTDPGRQAPAQDPSRPVANQRPGAHRMRWAVVSGAVALGAVLLLWSPAPAWFTGARPRTTDPRVVEAYLRGRHHLSRGTEPEFARGRQYLEAALALDPRHAPSHAGLADYYVLNDSLPPAESLALARSHAERAIAIDDRLADAHVSLGYVRFYGDWDWAGAETAFQRALTLDPAHVRAHRWFALALAATGRRADADAAIQRALALDPVAMVNHDAAATIHFNARRFAEAARVARSMIELDRFDVRGYEHLALASIQLGAPGEALEAMDTALGLAPTPMLEAFRAMALGQLGRHDEARQVLDGLMPDEGPPRLPEVIHAIARAALGQRDRALEALDRAHAVRDPYLVLLRVTPWFDPLRDDRRYQQLVERLAFPPLTAP